ncbi:MAG TPA: hypothetical protein DHV28_06140 [Ignavibacteriales bacterium]|nr:hypothetical protein [Ignavibacteriales bacterium]
MNNLPPNWSWVKLGDVCKILDNKRSPINSDERDKRISGKPIESLFPYYGATGQVGYIDDFLLEGEFVLLGEDGAPFLEKRKPKAYIVNGKIWVNNHAHILLSKNHNKFLCYYLNFLDYHPFVTGTTRLKLNQSSMRQIPIINPPLPEQKKIVEKIEELFSGLDSGVASLKKAKEQIRLYRQSVLASAFSGKLTQSAKRQAHSEMLKAAEPKVEYSTQLPDGWKWVKFEEVITFLGSGVTPRGGRNVYKTEGIKFIRSQNVYPNRLVLEDIAYITNDIDEKMERSRVKPLDVLLNITGASIGRAANIPESFGPANVNQHVCILRTNQNEVRSKYLSLYLNSNFAQQHINRIQIGATRQALNYSQIKMFPFPLCPVYQQTQIVEEIEKRFSEADNIEKAIDESLIKAETLRQSVLKQAFEGKLI